MKTLRVTLALVLLACLLPSESASGQKKRKAPGKSATEEQYYQILTFTPPEGAVVEAGAVEVLPDGRVAVGTRRGEVWMLEGAYADDPKLTKWSRYAHGLHEVLGLAWKDGWLYVTQRPDVTRIRDSKGTGRADVFECVTDGWEINGDYHEYAFGSRFDKDGNIWIALCLTGSFSSSTKFRGWAGKVTKDGKFVPTTSGVRSPGGIGLNAEGDVFYTDNQGPWNGTCHLKHVKEGGFVGHPDGFKWYADPAAKHLGDAPAVPKSGGRIVTEARRIPQLIPPAVSFPYGKMGQSASGVECDLSGGKFGPFAGQLFVGDQTHSTVMRCFLEKVNGRYQGACFPFKAGFGSGVVPVRQGKDGSLFVGSTNRGWGSRGPKPFAVERLAWTGKVPFEVKEMRAKPDGFELVFTRPAGAAAADVRSYALKSYTYIYQAAYGSPVVDETTPAVEKAALSADGTRVRLTVRGLVEGNVHELTAKGVRAADGEGLLHEEAYYTLNQI
ncbi:MAG: PQQ-dependent sugar dehydrogenase, partial [Gemmataceae bacterium]